MLKKILLAAAAAATVATTAAQPGTLRITLDDAIRIALSDNPTIRIAELEIERQDYVRAESRGGLLPSLSVSGQYSRSIVKSEMAKGLSFGADNNLSATADLSLPLIAPQLWQTLRMNRTQLAAAVESARSNRLDLVAAVRKAYYNILLAQQSLEVLRASEQNIQETVDNTRTMYENGLAAEYDLISAEVQLSNLQPSIIQTENSIVVSKLMLKMYLSLPETIDIALDGTLDGYKEQVADRAIDLSTDLTANSELRQLEIEQKLLGDQLRVAQAARMPVVSAFGTLTVSGNDMQRFSFGDIGGSTGESGTATTPTTGGSSFWWQHPISAGIQLSIPIFSGLRNTSRVRQLRNQIDQMEWQRNYREQNLDVEVRSAINNLLTARASMLATEKTVAQAEKAYDISNTRYEAGAGTILELNSSELQRTEARLNYSQAIYDYLSAEAEYDRLVGRGA